MIALEIDEGMKGKDRNDRRGSESYREEPRESQKGAVTAYDSAEAPDREGQGDGKEDGGCEFAHGSTLSEPLDQAIVKI